MFSNFYNLSKLALKILVLCSFSTTVSCQNAGIINYTLFTCCHMQDTLREDGTCDQPKNEFAVVFFNEAWDVPSQFKANEDSFSKFSLTRRNCYCKDSKVLAKITFGKSHSSKGLTFDPTGTLRVSNNVEYGPENYCFNRLEDMYPYKDAVEIDIRLCSNACQRHPQSRTSHFRDFSDESHAPVARAPSCSDHDPEVTDCKRTTLLVKSDYFSIVDLNSSSTPIKDQTYPWKSLSKSYFCEDSSSGEAVYRKYCIPALKNYYYYYQKVYAILSGVSGIFLLFNLAIYFALRGLLSISGWTEFMYSLSLYLYCVFSIPGLLIVPDDEQVGTSCYVLSILIQFFELANGATLVALSCDILLTFWKYDKQGYTDDPKLGKFRLSLYILLSIVVPSGIITYGVLKNQEIVSDDFGTPRYGLLHCTSPDWVVSTYTRFGMQSLNLVLVLISAYVILNKRVVRQDFGVLQEVLIELNPDRMDIFSKLFVFVFAFWTIDFMDVFLSKEIFTDEWHGIAFQVINYTQGISAFFILVFNRQTLRACGEKNWSLKQMFQHACTCGTQNNFEDDEIQGAEEAQMSPFMKTGTIQSYKRSTVRGDKFY